jgi:hypothetical protein
MFIYYELVETLFLELTLIRVPTLKVLFYQILPDFRNSITFWNVPRLRPLGIFSETFDKSMCPGSTQPLRNEYQDIPGGKGGRCVGLTTLPP